jgi:hypothetical protein
MGTVLFCVCFSSSIVRSVAHRDWPEIGINMECFFMCGCIKGVTRDPIDDTQSITWEGERSSSDRHCFKVWKAKYAHLYTAREALRSAMVKDKALDYAYLGVYVDWRCPYGWVQPCPGMHTHGHVQLHIAMCNYT